MAILNIKGFPNELYALLQHRAELDRRSLAQEIIFLLEVAVKESEIPSILELRGLGKKSWKGTAVRKHINSERDSWE